MYSTTMVAAKTLPPTVPHVLPEADEITAMMLAQVFEATSCRVQVVSVTSLADEMDKLLDERTADVVCVCATPPAAAMHARYLCKRLRARFPKVKLVVGLWDTQGDLSKAKERIGCGASVAATLAEAQEQVRQLIKPLLPPENQTQPESGPGGLEETHV